MGLLSSIRRLLGLGAGSPAEAEAPGAPADTEQPAEASPLAAAMNAFALDLWRTLSPTGNAVFSPGSAWLALSTVASGTQGATREELSRLLHLPAGDELDEAIAQQVRDWDDHDEDAGLTLRVANRLFADDAVAFEPAWLEHLEATHHATAERLDFGDAERARDHINEWVEAQTAGHIRGLVPRGALSARGLAVVNAVYFAGRWVAPFTKRLTRPNPFHTPDGPREVPTMRKIGEFEYAERAEAQLLVLPFLRSALELVVVLPRALDGLAALERQLSAPLLERWLAGSAVQDVDVSLPRFTIEPGESVSLRAVLERLGVTLVFDAGRADFTRASRADPVALSDAFHRAFIRVDEEGAEAAAATAVAGLTGAAPRQRPEPKRFVAHHPFLFLLRDTASGAWLFLGRVVAP